MTALDTALLAHLAATAGLAEPSIVLRALSPQWPSATLDADRQLYPASMIKLPIAFALEAARAARTLTLADLVTIEASNMTTNDAPSAFVPGYTARLADLGRAMLASSDNVATNVLIDVLGRTQIDEACARLGLARTHVGRKLSGSLPLIDDPLANGRNTHTADDSAALFERLCNPATRSSWIWEALVAQVWNDKLSRGLRCDDNFAHKTGDTDEVSHDGGVLTTASGRTYVLVVYTSLAATPENDARHAAFASALRPYLD